MTNLEFMRIETFLTTRPDEVERWRESMAIMEKCVIEGAKKTGDDIEGFLHEQVIDEVDDWHRPEALQAELKRFAEPVKETFTLTEADGTQYAVSVDKIEKLK